MEAALTLDNATGKPYDKKKPKVGDIDTSGFATAQGDGVGISNDQERQGGQEAALARMKKIERLMEQQAAARASVAANQTSHSIELVAKLLDQGLKPFRIEFPRAALGYELICAVSTAAARKEWLEAIEVGSTLAPFRGYLMKKKGRQGSMIGLLGGWDKRWFEVLQPHGEDPATITFYKDEEDYKAGIPRGVVDIDGNSSVEATTQFEQKGHPHALKVKTGPEDNAMTTYLAASTFVELEKWKSAINRALRSFHREGKVKPVSDAEKKLAKLPLEKLRSTLAYMGVAFDEKTQDPSRLAFLIVRERERKERERRVSQSKVVAPRKFNNYGPRGAQSALMRKVQAERKTLTLKDVHDLVNLLDFMDV